MANERAEIARMKSKIDHLRYEMESRPDRREQIEAEIANLEYMIREAERRMR